MTIWFTSDTHFDHANMITKFVLADGSPSRTFSCVEEMNETMIDRWNAVVRPSDHIYHLGDVTMHRQVGQLKYRILDRLQGHKRLLLGNHDADKVQNYLPWFQKIFASRVIDHILFTHIPVHVESVGRFIANVHGHTHHNCLPAPYVNVCVERTNYAPVSLEQIKAGL